MARGCSHHQHPAGLPNASNKLKTALAAIGNLNQGIVLCSYSHATISSLSRSLLEAVDPNGARVQYTAVDGVACNPWLPFPYCK
jgi:hypothetical protein